MSFTTARASSFMSSTSLPTKVLATSTKKLPIPANNFPIHLNMFTSHFSFKDFLSPDVPRVHGPVINVVRSHPGVVFHHTEHRKEVRRDLSAAAPSERRQLGKPGQGHKQQSVSRIHLPLPVD